MKTYKKLTSIYEGDADFSQYTEPLIAYKFDDDVGTLLVIPRCSHCAKFIRCGEGEVVATRDRTVIEFNGFICSSCGEIVPPHYWGD